MVGPKAIVRIVSEYRSVSAAELAGDVRDRAVAWPRQEASWLMRHRTRLSFSAIGRILGGRDHTTILAALRAVESRAAESSEYRVELHEMLARIDSAAGEDRSAHTSAVNDLAVQAIRQAGGVSNADAIRLATGILTVSSILQNETLTDRETRDAARSVLTSCGGGRHA